MKQGIAYIDDTYINVRINATTPPDLILMLYNGALNFILEARNMILKGNTEEKCKLIGKAIAIISHLLETLEYDNGDKIAERLESLYININTRLLMANLNNSVMILEEVANILKELKYSWLEVNENGIRYINTDL